MLPIMPWRGSVPTLFTQRQLKQREDVDQAVMSIIADVRKRGDAALIEYTRRFDGVTLTPETLYVSRQEVEAAYALVPQDVQDALREAAANIRAYHERQKREDFMETQSGKTLGRVSRPLDAVGLYAPGGTAAYPSSALMNIVPALVAGVGRIVLTTPPQKDGTVYAATLVAADIASNGKAGTDALRIVRAGGAQAVAALALGTESVDRVDRIVGPGNAYVATAKRMLFGEVGIDMFAGPSEILIVADDSANPAWLAADMLSQAEHDEMASAVLLTTSQAIAEAVLSELSRQTPLLPRADIAARAISGNSMVLVVPDLPTAIEAANAFAPEHLELAVADPGSLLPSVRNAGCVFMGHHAPEPLGDYWAGTNHVLPTSGTARFSSALSVDDFTKTISIVSYSPEALAEAAPKIALLARAEGLEAHARSAEIRQSDV